MKKIIMFGATGSVGSEVLKILEKDPSVSKIYTVQRKNTIYNSKKIEVIISNGDYNKLNIKTSKNDDVHVITTLGTTIKKAKTKENFYKVDHNLVLESAKFTKNQDFSSFSFISSLGANPKSNSFYLKTKGCVEEEIISLGIKRLNIYRPSVYLNRGREFRLGEFLSVSLLCLFSLFLIGKLKKYRPTNIKKLAISIVKNLEKKDNKINLFESDQL